MTLARRIASAAALTITLGVALAPIAAAVERPAAAAAPREPAEPCPIVVRTVRLPCEAAPPIELEITVDPPVGNAPAAPPIPSAAVAHLPPPAIDALGIAQPVELIAESPPVDVSPPPTDPSAVSAPLETDVEVAAAAPVTSPPAVETAAVAVIEPAATGGASEPVGAPATPASTLAAEVHPDKAQGTPPTPRASPLTDAVERLPVSAPLAVIALTPALGSATTVAIEVGRTGGPWAATVVFNVWLRRQLRERRMSQRQLAVFSGVDHSTISRLLSGARTPTLATATKLAEALRKLGGPDHPADYFARLSEPELFPTKRVEAALLGDDGLEDEDIRELMNAYLLLRARRRVERTAAAENGEGAS